MKIKQQQNPNTNFKRLPYRGYKICHKIITSTPEMNYDSYTRMSGVKKKLLRIFSPKRVKEIAKESCSMAEKIKTSLDSYYKDYVLVTIGRSLATVAESFQLLGGKAKIIPLSDLRSGLYEGECKNIDKFSEFLSSIGLNSNTIKSNPDTKFLIMDYTVSGYSLENAFKFLSSENLLGKSQNLVAKEVNGLISKFQNELLYYRRFKNYSPVGRLQLNELDKVFLQSNYKTCKEYSNEKSLFLRKLFLFHLFDSIKRNNFHGTFPKREFKIIEHLNSSPSI